MNKRSENYKADKIAEKVCILSFLPVCRIDPCWQSSQLIKREVLKYLKPLKWYYDENCIFPIWASHFEA